MPRPAAEQRSGLGERLFARLQWILPTRLLSGAMHRLAESRRPWLKNALIRAFMRLYKVDLDDAQIREPTAYPSFNAFFIRPLRADARPLPEATGLATSPVDGRLGQFGTVTTGRLLQAKGQTYDVVNLLARREDLAAPFLGGGFATLYLAPHDYHRVHMPLAGVLRETLYVPGRLFAVNPASVRTTARLFTRNERLIALFDTAVGPMALILIGAFGVGGITTTWAGTVTPPHRRVLRHESYAAEGSSRIAFERGQEMGHFNLGSTVILLFGPGALTWQAELESGQIVRLGQALGRLNPGS